MFGTKQMVTDVLMTSYDYEGSDGDPGDDYHQPGVRASVPGGGE